MSKPVVFVIGASGRIGQATVKALSENYSGELQIKAGVRNPEKVAEFNSLAGVRVVQADMGKPDSLLDIFKNVNYLFIVTPGAQDRADLTIDTAQKAKTAGIQNILVISTAMAQFPETIFGRQFSAIEEAIAKLGVTYTILRLPNFMEGNLYHKYSIKKNSAFSTTAEPTQWFLEVTHDDAGLAAAFILASPEKHAGKTYLIVSDRHTYKDMEEAYTKALGREVKYVPINCEEAKILMLKVGLPEWQINGLAEVFHHVNDGSLDTNDDYTKVFQDITGKQPTNFTMWLSKFIDEFQ